MSQNRFWNLLSKKLSGEAMPDELAELQLLIKQNPDWVFAAEQIEGIWKLQPKQVDPYDAEVAFAQHIEQQKNNGLAVSELETPVTIESLTSTPISRKTNKLGSFLVVIVVLLCIAGFLWTRRPVVAVDPVVKKNFSEVSTRLGNKSRIVLPDSSIVWLNAGSQLTYNGQFGINNRNTTLSGEAYFEVKKSTIPFIIHASPIDIKVLGTVLNVKYYPNEKTTETTLIHGRIEISFNKRPGEKFILKPHEKLIVANEMSDMLLTSKQQKMEPMVVLSSMTMLDHHIIETSWVDNKLVFQDETVEEMARKMERWYNVTIRIPDQKVAQMRVTGTFENETLKQALDALQIAFRFNYTIHQNIITITQ